MKYQIPIKTVFAVYEKSWGNVELGLSLILVEISWEDITSPMSLLFIGLLRLPFARPPASYLVGLLCDEPVEASRAAQAEAKGG